MTACSISAPIPFPYFRSSPAQRKLASPSLPSKSFACEPLPPSPPNPAPPRLKTVAPSTKWKKPPACPASSTSSMPHLRPPDIDRGGNIRSIPSSTKPTADSLGEPAYHFPTSLAQQSFWYLDRLEPGNPCCNIAVRFRITGALDIALLEPSVTEISTPHEIVRTSFATIA